METFTHTEPSAPSSADLPTFGEIVAETEPLVDYVPAAGTPVVFILAPWLLFGLMLAGPFAVLVTLALVMVAAIAIVALAAALVASPFLLVRHLRARAADVAVPVPAPVPVRPTHVVPARRVAA